MSYGLSPDAEAANQPPVLTPPRPRSGPA
jgi:hypothetical protein